MRRLAAVDLYGAAGTVRRRRIIRAEFVAGVACCVAFGLGALLLSTSVGFVVLGAWLVGVGLNYVPLAAHAVSLYEPAKLEAELAAVDVRAEQRHYTRVQVAVFVPLLIVVLAARQEWRRRAATPRS